MYDSVVLIEEHLYRRWISSFVNCIYINFYDYASVLGKYYFNDIYLF